MTAGGAAWRWAPLLAAAAVAVAWRGGYTDDARGVVAALAGLAALAAVGAAPEAAARAARHRIVLTLAALLPYWRLLTFSVVYVTDDYFASDIFNGELPARVLIGRLIRDGQLPVWTNQLCSGLSLTGSPADPIGLLVFTLLPPAAALDLLVIVLLLVAAHGTYGLARRFGAARIEVLVRHIQRR